ncbi:acyltransferase family protein [Cellulomonas massiliensis]|uniref:acyltransferase family protein n=1 Tax=Cellulomonas massiliensis TaxID=1465811 RepID=UPI0002FB589B|nr:acyltransferase [Cellulomonas massiliensis]
MTTATGTTVRAPARAGTGRPDGAAGPAEVAGPEGRGPGRPADGTPTAVRAGARLAALDGLRFVAAMAVVLFHFTSRRTSPWDGRMHELLGGVGAWTAYGSLGPELFFVISGFVVLMTAWGRPTAQFVASRVGRIYPAYWVAVVATGLLLLLVWPQGKRVTGEQVLVNLTMLQSGLGVKHVDGVYWTLWTELRFYLLVALLALAGITTRRVLAFCFLWPLAGLAVQQAGWDTAAHWLVSDKAPLFAAGMALYVLHREGHRLVPWLAVLGSTALSVHLVAADRAARLEHETGYTFSAVALGVAVVACVAVVALLALTRLADVRLAWLTWLGALTYPLYLVHQYWGLYLVDLLVDRIGAWGAVTVATAAALVAAWALHRFVEVRWGPRLRRATQAGLERLRDALVLDRVNRGPRLLESAWRPHAS